LDAVAPPVADILSKHPRRAKASAPACRIRRCDHITTCRGREAKILWLHLRFAGRKLLRDLQRCGINGPDDL
jgi:hypothetical protein